MKMNKWTHALASLGLVERRNMIQAMEATGHTTMREHVEKMERAAQKAACADPRFCEQPAGSSYMQKPYVLGVTTPDEKGCQHAIINTAKGETVRHGFEYNAEDGTGTFCPGESLKTERTTVYARRIEEHDAMMLAAQEVISCRATSGTKLTAGEKWVAGESVSYIYVPGGVSTINAGFRKGESITCTVVVDEKTAVDLQDSFDFLAATEKQEPYADEDHEGKKATIRFPAGKVEFTYGTLKGEEGIIVNGAEPTSYGADSVNGKVYASWSPEFATDAEYKKAVVKKGHWTFPDGVRGSATNPARMIAVSFVTGALTNKPAFKNMPPVKATEVTPPELTADELLTREHVAKQHTDMPWIRAALGLPETPAPEPDIDDEKIKAQWSEEARAASAAARKKGANDNSEILKHRGDALEQRRAVFASPNHEVGLSHGEKASESANKASEIANKNGDEHSHLHAGRAHTEAKSAHEELARLSGDNKTEKFHKGEAAKHGLAEKQHLESASIKAKETPSDSKATLETIYARANQQRAVIAQIETRVPQAAARGAMESLYARLGVNG